jgi:hypothetical protein
MRDERFSHFSNKYVSADEFQKEVKAERLKADEEKRLKEQDITISLALGEITDVQAMRLYKKLNEEADFHKKTNYNFPHGKDGKYFS